MQYAIYLRKSRADLDAESHGEGETLLRHETELLRVAKKMNISVTRIYREVVSGENIASRPEMIQLLSDVESCKFTGVLVMEIERLARGDSIDQGVVAQAFKTSNTKIITPNKIFDPSNEFDEEYFEFNLFMSRREYKTINRRIQRGRIASVEEGKFIGSVPPYGYNKVKIKNDKGYTLEIDPIQGEIIENIFLWYTKGELREDGTYEKIGATRIAKKLNDMGIRPLYNEKWTKPTITDILKNPVYTGKIRWSYRKEKKYVKDNKVHKVRRENKDHKLVQGLHKPIIDENTFNIAQSIISKRGHAPVPGYNILKNPLSGIVYCNKCKNLMTRLSKSSKTPYDTLVCINPDCDNISAPLYLVEDVIIDFLNKWLADYKIQWEANKNDMPFARSISLKQSVIDQMNSNLEKLKAQKEKIYSLLEQGIYTSDIFTERMKKLQNEIETLNNNIVIAEAELTRLNKQASYNDVFIPEAENLLNHYYDLETAAARNEALKYIINSVVYQKDTHNKKGERDNTNFEIEVFPNVMSFKS